MKQTAGSQCIAFYQCSWCFMREKRLQYVALRASVADCCRCYVSDCHLLFTGHSSWSHGLAPTLNTASSQPEAFSSDLLTHSAHSEPFQSRREEHQREVNSVAERLADDRFGSTEAEQFFFFFLSKGQASGVTNTHAQIF